jgi:N-succinyldiaminopimelate aminotransferase
MRARTITLGSLGKSFSLTGWKIGWAIAPPGLTAAVRAAHQFLTFAVATPLQHAAAVAVACDDRFYQEQAAVFAARRDRLAGPLRAMGFRFADPDGGYFILADHSAVSARLGCADDEELCAALIDRAGVAAIPPSVFYQRKVLGRAQLRFAFCKTEATIDEAVRRLSGLLD